MIQFTCRCKYAFEVPEEMGGQQIQCPNCMLLVDVPTHDELEQLSEDGTIRIDAPSPVAEPNRFAQLKRAYSREHVDDQGVEIDLRNTPEQIAAAGTDESSSGYEEVPHAPKYDPETGELVRPLDIQEDTQRLPHPSHIPMAQTALNYATPDLNIRPSIFYPLMFMVRPINLAAMAFVLVAHLFLVLAMFSIFLSVFAILVVGIALIAHYANVIEEVALEERDELPRFLRHFDWADDIWLPFIRVCVASLLCFWPGMVVKLAGVIYGWPPIRVAVVYYALNIFGMILFPATLLSATTSGSWANLRIDRIFGTIASIGARYAFFVVLFGTALAIYWNGFDMTISHFFQLFVHGPTRAWFEMGLIDYGILMGGIFLMHYFAFLLGLSYRTEHNSFPWLYQHHVRSIPGVTAPRYPAKAPFQDLPSEHQ